MSDHDTIEQVINDLQALGERNVSTLCEEDRKLFADRNALGELRDRLNEVINGDNHYMVFAKNNWTVTGYCGCGNQAYLVCNVCKYIERLDLVHVDNPELECPNGRTICMGSNPPAEVQS